MHPYPERYSVGWRRMVRPMLKALFVPLFHLLLDLHFEGLENVPEAPPYLVIFNHVSILEPPLILAFWPVWLEPIAASYVFERPTQGPLVWLYGAIPVYKGKPDRAFLDFIVRILQQGYPVAMAPEGTRSHRPGMQRAWTGLAYLADRTRLPIVPVGFVGTEDETLRQAFRFRRPRVEIRIGKPFRLPPLDAWPVPRKQARRYNTDLAMYRIAALLPPEYRGVYNDPEGLAIAQTLTLDLPSVPPAQTRIFQATA